MEGKEIEKKKKKKSNFHQGFFLGTTKVKSKVQL